jgi:hypothetical protein
MEASREGDRAEAGRSKKDRKQTSNKPKDFQAN